MLAQITTISYHTEVFVKKEVGCTVFVLLIVIQCGGVGSYPKIGGKECKGFWLTPKVGGQMSIHGVCL